MKLKEGLIRELQEHIKDNLVNWGFDDESLHERLLLLTEEIGELVNACRKISSMHVDSNREINNKPGEEIADILNLVFSVAIKLNLDVETEYLNKENIINKRKYSRTRNA